MANYKYLDLTGLGKYDEKIKNYIQTQTEEAGTVECKIVSQLPGADSAEAKEGVIYFVRDTGATANDYYLEFILVHTGTTATTTGREWEKLGQSIMTRAQWQDLLQDVDDLNKEMYGVDGQFGLASIGEEIKPFFFDDDNAPYEIPESLNTIEKLTEQVENDADDILRILADMSEWAAITNNEINALFTEQSAG